MYFPFLSYYILFFLFFILQTMTSQLYSRLDNSNLQGKSKNVRVGGSLSYREYEVNNRTGGNGMGNECK